MNKAELIDAVAEGAELTKADAGRAVDAVIAAITKALKKGDTVTVVGFGTFRGAPARRTRRPQSAHGRNDQGRRVDEPRVQGRQGAEGRGQLTRFFGRVLSSAVERLLYTERVGGSIPSAPTTRHRIAVMFD